MFFRIVPIICLSPVDLRITYILIIFSWKFKGKDISRQETARCPIERHHSTKSPGARGDTTPGQ
jgi:hypothetical protein